MIFSNIFNSDFQDLIKEFNVCNVEYLLVGGYLVILNGYSRTTGDLDLWVSPTLENYSKMQKAFLNFGLPSDAITQSKFLNPTEYDVFTFGVAPVSINILTVVKGLSFENAYSSSKMYQIEDNLAVRGLSKSDLIKAKQAAGRNKDLDDLENIK